MVEAETEALTTVNASVFEWNVVASMGKTDVTGVTRRDDWVGLGFIGLVGETESVERTYETFVW